MTLAALPTLDVYIAFNPTASGATLFTANQQTLPASGASNTYWTNVASYVQDFQTRAGKQHFLDRVEATTVLMTVNNRNGFFTNGSVNGTGSVLDTRKPIAITATWNPTGSTPTPYPIFWGITDSVQEVITDALNSELRINASDLTKYLSLKDMASTNFWSTYANSTSTTNWYRCDVTAQASVTGAVSPSVYGVGYTDYTAVNNFQSGQYVSVVGLTTITGASLNTGSTSAYQVYGTPTSSSFTLAYNPGSGINGTGGTATVMNTPDNKGTGIGYYYGAVSFQTNGAMVYDNNGSVDLANASTGPSGYMSITNVPASTSGGLDFWFLGGGSAGTQITTIEAGGYGSGGPNIQLWASPRGVLEAVLYGQSIGTITSATSTSTALTLHGSFASGALSTNLAAGQWLKLTGFTPSNWNGEWQIASSNSTTINLTSTNHPATATVIGNVSSVILSNVTISNGYWHHIGLVNNSSNQLCIYADGTLTPISWSGSYYNGFSTYNASSFSSAPLVIGGSNGNLGDTNTAATCPCIVDEIIISNNSNTSTLYSSEVLSRYRAGSLLQLGFPTTATNYTSADRIAEILTIAGYGQVVGNSITLNSNIFYVNGVAYSYLTGQGAVVCEPFYWDAPITGSTALSLIQQVTDTDIGGFFQDGNGHFQFYNQNYYGTWTWNSTTNTGSWSLGTRGSTATAIWSDANTGVPYDGPSLQTMRDDVDLWTTVKVTPQAGIDQIYENTSAEPLYGYSTLVKSSTLHSTLNSALSTANFLGYLFRSPIPRVQNVELRAESTNQSSGTPIGYYIPNLIGTTFGTVINFQRTPPNASGAGVINNNYVVESVSHDFKADPGQWHTSFVLDPYPVRT